MPDSTKCHHHHRPFILNVDTGSDNDSPLQLAAMICSLRDMCITHIAKTSGKREEEILRLLDSLYDGYYQNFLEQMHRNN